MSFGSLAIRHVPGNLPRASAFPWPHGTVNQKVIIQSACTPLDQVGEQALCDAAVRLCTAAGYRGAGSDAIVNCSDHVRLPKPRVSVCLRLRRTRARGW